MAKTKPTTVKFSMSIAPALFAHYGPKDEFAPSIGERIVRVLLKDAAAQAAKDNEPLDPEIDREALFWDLVDRVEVKARLLLEEEGFSADMTLRTVQACTADPGWLSDYERFIGDNAFKNGNPEKGRINREIGFRVKRAARAQTVEKNGKADSVKVLGEIIQTYSLLYLPEHQPAG